MDAIVKNKIEWLGTLNQQLTNVVSDAPDEYNRILKTYFDNKLIKDGGLKGGIPALLVVPAAAKYSPAPIAAEVSAVTTDVWIDGVLYSGTVEAASAATGAAAGGAALGIAVVVVAAGIAIYFSAKNITKAVLNKSWVKQGKKNLESLRTNVISMRVYCNSMTSNLESAINSLTAASEKIAIAEGKIAKQQYATRDSNLKAIRERQAEVVALCTALKSTIDLVKITKANLDVLV